MRKNKNYSVDEVLRSLSRKHDVRVEGSFIKILNGKSKKAQPIGDLGIRTQGKIDFLVNYKGYKRVYVSEF